MEIETDGLELKTGDIINIFGMDYKVSETQYNFDPFEPDPDDMVSKDIYIERIKN